MPGPEHIPPAIQQFFVEALPNDGGNHTLAVGEDHTLDEHIHWIKAQLPYLKQHHNLTTLGLEAPGYENIFFWAYQDGTLVRALGSQHAARTYLKEALTATTREAAKIKAHETVGLSMDAIDAGIRVVSYDSRRTINEVTYFCTKDSNGKPSAELTANAHGIGAPDRNQLATNKVHQKRLRDDTDYSYVWQLGEIAWLKQLNPEYASRLEKIEQLIETGHKKIRKGKLTSDGLSAVLFQALAAPGGNRVTIGGQGHISGIYSDYRDPIRNVHGSFGHHLFAMGQPAAARQPRRVTSSIVATTVNIQEMMDSLNERLLDSNHPRIASKLHTLDITKSDGPLGIYNSPPDTALPIEKAFMPKPTIGRKLANLLAPEYLAAKREAHVAAHINPLLMPDIKAAAEAVRVAVNGSAADRTR